MSRFSSLKGAPEDPIFGLTAAFLQDPRPRKINLGIGVYKTEELTTPVLNCVKQAEKQLIEMQLSKSYLPVQGDPIYLESIAELIFGSSVYNASKECFSCIQTPGGSGALRLGGELLYLSEKKKIYIPNPSWPNHRGIFSQAGLICETYPYYDVDLKEVAFEKMIDFLKKLQEDSVVVFHVNCHNPSGADLNKEQWRIVAKLCREKGLIPFFDAAYLGFCDGIEEDAFPIRLFIEQNIEFLLSVSFSKNLALYAERVGAFFLFSDPLSSRKILSQCKILVRRNYSNPPMHGAKIVSTILKTTFLKCLWDEELLWMRQRIFEIRNNFVAALSLAGCARDYSYLLNKKGLFFFSNLSPEQVERLKKEHAIYITEDGRINIAGLNEESLSFVAKAVVQVGG